MNGTATHLQEQGRGTYDRNNVSSSLSAQTEGLALLNCPAHTEESQEKRNEPEPNISRPCSLLQAVSVAAEKKIDQIGVLTGSAIKISDRHRHRRPGIQEVQAARRIHAQLRAGERPADHLRPRAGPQDDEIHVDGRIHVEGQTRLRAGRATNSGIIGR